MPITTADIDDNIEQVGMFAVYDFGEDFLPHQLIPPLDPTKRLGYIISTRDYAYRGLRAERGTGVSTVLLLR